MNVDKFRSDRVRASHYTGQQTGSSRRAKRQQEFLRGPVPLPWLSQAVTLPGKTIAVGIAIWFAVGLQKSIRVKITRALRERLSITRKTCYHGLRALESAGLITVERHEGRCPVVTVREGAEDDNREPKS